MRADTRASVRVNVRAVSSVLVRANTSESYRAGPSPICASISTEVVLQDRHRRVRFAVVPPFACVIYAIWQARKLVVNPEEINVAVRRLFKVKPSSLT